MRNTRLAALALFVSLAPSLWAAGRLVDQSWQATKTIQAARSLATALAAYRMDHGRYPAAQNIAAVRIAIEDRYIRTAEEQDGWGNDFLYRVSDDGSSFVLASAGSDRAFDESSWKTSGYSTSSKDDLVYTSGDVLREWVIQDICH